jgi:hypothetical protein
MLHGVTEFRRRIREQDELIAQLQSDLERAGDKNAALERENIRLNSELNQHILSGMAGGQAKGWDQ